MADSATLLPSFGYRRKYNLCHPKSKKKIELEWNGVINIGIWNVGV